MNCIHFLGWDQSQSTNSCIYPFLHTSIHRSNRYLDRKWALRGEAASGFLSLRFTVTEPASPVAVCEVACAWGKCPASRASLLDPSAVEYQLGQIAQAGVPREAVSGGSRLGSDGSNRLPAASAVQSEDETHSSLRLLVKSKVCYQIALSKPSSSSGSGSGGGSTGLLDEGTYVLRLRVVKKDAYVLLTHLIWY